MWMASLHRGLPLQLEAAASNVTALADSKSWSANYAPPSAAGGSGPESPPSCRRSEPRARPNRRRSVCRPPLLREPSTGGTALQVVAQLDNYMRGWVRTQRSRGDGWQWTRTQLNIGCRLRGIRRVCKGFVTADPGTRARRCLRKTVCSTAD